MDPFVRIKNYVINLQNLAYAYIGENYIEFSFAASAANREVPDRIRFQRGSDLQDSEFDELRDFVLQLPDPDRVIVV